MKPKRVISYCAVLLVCLLQSTVALSRPDFSGTWVMDKKRSFSNPPGLEQTLNITHTGDQIKLESKLVTARGEQAINESYTLDGKERDLRRREVSPARKASAQRYGRRRAVAS